MATSALQRLPVIALVLALTALCNTPLIGGKPDDKSDDGKDSSSDTSLDLSRQTSSTKTETPSGSPLGNALGHGGSFFGAGEIQIIGFAAGGTGHDNYSVTEEHTVKHTKTITQTHLETQTTFTSTFVPAVFRRDPIRIIVPAHYVVTPVVTQVPVTTSQQVTTTSTTKTTKNVAGVQGGFAGAGAEARYFLTPWLGFGVEGDWLDGNSSTGTTLSTITARLIKDSNAYYIFGGTGVQFDQNQTQAIGKFGIGIEHRFAFGTGVFADAAWMFGSHENAAVFRSGFRLSL